tara:strand:+ start:59 stop:226 length:168 start_codon:yes stop_codon:yes gene_type:complete
MSESSIELLVQLQIKQQEMINILIDKTQKNESNIKQLKKENQILRNCLKANSFFD